MYLCTRIHWTLFEFVVDSFRLRYTNKQNVVKFAYDGFISRALVLFFLSLSFDRYYMLKFIILVNTLPHSLSLRPSIIERLNWHSRQHFSRHILFFFLSFYCKLFSFSCLFARVLSHLQQHLPAAAAAAAAFQLHRMILLLFFHLSRVNVQKFLEANWLLRILRFRSFAYTHTHTLTLSFTKREIKKNRRYVNTLAAEAA